MGRHGWLLGVGMFLLLGGTSSVAAADTEVRDFTVWIDGKNNAGTYQMTITNQDDGTQVMTGTADVSIKRYLVYTYTYWYRGTEVWKDGRLQQLESKANDDGKAFTVQARVEGNALTVRVNGKQERRRPDVWTSTYWRLPEAPYRNRGIPLLDADTGRYAEGGLHYVETQALNVGSQVQNCTHYRVTGLVPTDVWYDAQERLVRRDWVEDGHRIILDLVRVTRR